MKKILAIGDSQDELTVLKTFIMNLIPGCSFIIARSGTEGIEKAKNECPDTILLEIEIPEMDGFEVCNRLKNDSGTKHIPIIIISEVKTESADFVKVLDAGAVMSAIDPFVGGAELEFR